MLFNKARRGVSDSPAIDVAAQGRPYWAPKFWHGMTFRVWLRLLARNRFAIDLALWPAALVITAVTMVNSALALLQSLRFGRKIARTEIREPPVFIIGHWRSGTTLLHRLFSQDNRFAFPTTFDCFSPKSSLVTARFVRRWLGFLHPMRRLQDNMADGFDYPHEDEFALCSMGLTSPYVQFAFPNRPQAEEFVDFDGVASTEVNRWKAGLRWFLQLLTLRTGKRIVLKSPPHTARIRRLLELFPDARFVHIVRHPFEVFPSMVWTRKVNYRAHGLQRPCYDGMEEFVYRNFLRMHRAYRDQKDLIPPGNLCEVRYEDLIRDPLGNMQAIYEQLDLGEFDRVRPALDAYLAGQQGYKTNRFHVSRETRAEISHRWAEFMHEYGYAAEEGEQTESEVSSEPVFGSEAVADRCAA